MCMEWVDQPQFHGRRKAQLRERGSIVDFEAFAPSDLARRRGLAAFPAHQMCNVCVSLQFESVSEALRYESSHLDRCWIREASVPVGEPRHKGQLRRIRFGNPGQALDSFGNSARLFK